MEMPLRQKNNLGEIVEKTFTPNYQYGIYVYKKKHFPESPEFKEGKKTTYILNIEQNKKIFSSSQKHIIADTRWGYPTHSNLATEKMPIEIEIKELTPTNTQITLEYATYFSNKEKFITRKTYSLPVNKKTRQH